MLADGLDTAFIGIGHSAPNTLPVAVYDVELIFQVFMQRDGMTREEAQEFYDFNVLPAYVGKQTPMFLEPMP